MNTLRSRIAKLAHEKPELRAHLVPLLRTAMSGATVQHFLTYLTGKLTQYDQRQEAQDTKRGRPTNIYRLGHYLAAAEKVEADVRAFLKRDDPEAMEALRASLDRRFTPGFPPVNAVLKSIAAWEQGGKNPVYGK